MCKGVLPDHCQMLVVEREKVDRLTHKNQHAQGVPPSPYRYEGGRTSSPPKNYFLGVLDEKRPVKTDWQCGQQAKDSALPYYSQAHKMTFVLN